MIDLVVDGVIFRIQAKGGITRYFSELLPRLCDLEPELRITLLLRPPLRHPPPQHPRIAPRTPLRFAPAANAWSLWRQLAPRVNEIARRYHIGLTRHKIWHSTYFSLPSRWKGKQVVTVYDMLYELYPDLFSTPADERIRSKKLACIRQADAVLAISETTKKDLMRIHGLPAARIHVVHPACSSVFRRLDPGLRPAAAERPFLLYVGDRNHYKNFPTVLKAYSVWRERSRVGLVVVGATWAEHEAALLLELDLLDRVTLLTGVDDEALCRLYNTALALVYPSLYEGFGIPLLEAMACGCKVIASDIPSSRETAGDAAIYFEPQSIDSLLAAFDAAGAAGHDDLITKGQQRVRHYSWDQSAQRLLEVYRTLSPR